MTSSRRDFLNTTNLAVATIALPSWVLDAEAAVAARQSKQSG